MSATIRLDGRSLTRAQLVQVARGALRARNRPRSRSKEPDG